MTPYYQDDACTIYHGDCREIMPGLIADVLVTDPPYGLGYRSGWLDRSIAGDQDTDIRDAIVALWSPRPALVFGSPSIPRPKGTRLTLVWDKGEWPGMGDLSLPWGPSHEEIYVLGDGWVGPRSGTVIRATRLVGMTAHPNAKPEAALQLLIKKCPPGTILDPFCGSGTTLRAAKDFGRKSIGIELEERYAEIAAKRCAQEVLAL